MINWSEEARTTVEGFIRRGKATCRSITRAHILLKSAEGWGEPGDREECASALSEGRG